MDLRSQSKYWTGGFRSLGYERNHQKNLKTLRGAKSNGLFLGEPSGIATAPAVVLVRCVLNI